MKTALDIVKQNPIEAWRFNEKNTFERHKANGDMAKAYVCDDGFIHFCRDIADFRDLTEDFHGVICAAVVNNPKIIHEHLQKNTRVAQFLRKKPFIEARKRLILAFRGSFKSSIFSQAYPAWLIAREKELFGQVNIRIGLQSEEMELAEGNVRTVRNILASDKFMDLYGVHEPEKKTRARHKWSEKFFTSSFRTANLREPTCSPLSIEAEKTGRHFDVIISDDFQALRSSYTREQLAKVWRHLRLNTSLLNRTGIGWYYDKFDCHVWYSENIVGGTRWHYDDIYAHVIRENTRKKDKYMVLELPICDDDERALFPEVYDEREIESIRTDQGAAIYAGQYLLQPISDEDKIFTKDWITHHRKEELERKLPDMFRVVGIDVAWSDAEQGQRASEEARLDISVVETWAVDAGWNFYLIDCWGEKGATKREVTLEFFRQYFEHKANAVGADIYDKKYMWDTINQVIAEQKRTPFIVWNPHVTNNSMNKIDQIKGTLQGLFSQGKVKLLPGLVDFEAEILDCPMGKMNYLDAMVQAVKAAKPGKNVITPNEETIWDKHIKSLRGKNPKSLWGFPLRKKSNTRKDRSARGKTLKEFLSK